MVTLRLEDVATSQSIPAATQALQGPPAPSTPSIGSGASAEVMAAVKAYETDILDGALAEFLAKANEVDGILQQYVGRRKRFTIL